MKAPSKVVHTYMEPKTWQPAGDEGPGTLEVKLISSDKVPMRLERYLNAVSLSLNVCVYKTVISLVL